MIRYGRVATVDLAAGTCTVECGDVTTQGVRWQERAAGHTRTWSPPSDGEQVVLLCPDGDVAGAFALRGVTQDAHPLPGTTLAECVLFSDGTRISYDPEAHALSIAAGTGTVSIIATGGISITGDVAIDGNMTLTGTIEADGDITGAGVSLEHHTHGGVQSGGAETDEPS